MQGNNPSTYGMLPLLFCVPAAGKILSVYCLPSLRRNFRWHKKSYWHPPWSVHKYSPVDFPLPPEAVPVLSWKLPDYISPSTGLCFLIYGLPADLPAFSHAASQIRQPLCSVRRWFQSPLCATACPVQPSQHRCIRFFHSNTQTLLQRSTGSGWHFLTIPATLSSVFPATLELSVQILPPQPSSVSARWSEVYSSHKSVPCHSSSW